MVALHCVSSGKVRPLSHDPKDPRHNEPMKKIRKRNVTWFNPPFSKNVATNVGNKFFTLLFSCFPPNNKLHKIINKNNGKTKLQLYE